MRTAATMNLRALVRPSAQEGLWVAICLERYIVAQGESAKEALHNFAAMLAAEFEYGSEVGDPANPLAGIPQAPTKYWDEFDVGDPCRLRLPKPSQSISALPKVEKRLAAA